MDPPPTFSERLGAHLDAGAKAIGLPDTHFEQRLSFPKSNDFHGSELPPLQ